MAVVLLFSYGIVLGVTVSAWLFLLSAIPFIITAADARSRS